MNKIFLFAWMDDWHMSARLAKLSTSHSYDLIFFENGIQLPDSKVQSILIIDLDDMEEDEFQNSINVLNDHSVFIIGYARKLNGAKVKHFSGLGYNMVLKRNKLLRNMNSILQKIIHAH